MSGPGGEWRVRRVAALRGPVSPPGDKSISHRAVLLGALSRGITRVDGWLPSEDCKATLSIVKTLGVPVRTVNERMTSLEITGVGLGGLKAPVGSARTILNCGNSGTTLRLLAGILSGHPFPVTLTGDESLRRRPMKRLVDPLRELGAVVDGADEGTRAPLDIMGGELAGKKFDLAVASAQVKSSLLLAGLHARGVTRVREPSRSRDHTERALGRLGARYWKDDDGWHCVEGGSQFEAKPWKIPGDISAAAFFMAGAAIAPRSEVEILGVGLNPLRTGVIEVLQKMGARITITNERDLDGEPVGDVIVRGGGPLKAVRIAGETVPRLIDEIPVLAVAACFAEGITVIRDAAELRAKESDRIATMATELTKLGGRVGIFPDGMAIEGGQPLKGAEVESHGDHRVAMAMAIAGIGAAGETVVRDTANVATSYPWFMHDLEEMWGESSR